jgi:hypothetical protein
MGGEQNLLDRALAEAFLGNQRAAGTQQFKAGFAAAVQFRRQHRVTSFDPGRLASCDPELHRGSVVHQEETALLVLNRDAGREHSENIPQDAQLGFDRKAGVVFRGGGIGVVLAGAVHDRRACQTLS